MALPMTKQPVDRLEVFSRYITLTTFAIGILVFFLSPVWALAWRQEPFPGFLLEPTLVISNRSGEVWGGVDSGLVPPLAITRLAGRPIHDHQTYHQIVEQLDVGDIVPIFAIMPDGNLELFPDVELDRFPVEDLFQLFWLPYFIGLVYLAIGIWIYLARGSERPGRALAFFCGNIAIVTGLLFDALTSHNGILLWVSSLAMLGGALVSLSMRFPVEWHHVNRRPWILAIPYIVSITLAGWLLATVSDYQHPWRYLQARSINYLYIAGATIFFFVVMVYRVRAGSASLIRRQARVVLLGSLLAFIPIVIWFLAPLFIIQIPFNSFVFLPGLLLFPLSVSVAILRYRLLQFDVLVNRAIVYALVTAILAGGFSALAALSQRVFVVITGERSDAAVILTTLIIATAIVPVRNKIQGWIDRRWRDLPARTLTNFGNEVQFFVQMNDVDSLTQRFLKEAVETLHAQSGAIISLTEGIPEVINTSGRWRGNAQLSVPLVCQGERYGALLLGPRKNGRSYQRYEVDSLAKVAGQVAKAIRIAQALQTLARGANQQLQITDTPSS